MKLMIIMFSSIITKISPLILLLYNFLFSVYLLIYGSDIPGGGFIAGVLISNILFYFSISRKKIFLKKNILSIIYIGLFLILLTQILSIVISRNFFYEYILFSCVYFKLYSTLIYDIGIFIVVVYSLYLIFYKFLYNSKFLYIK